MAHRAGLARPVRQVGAGPGANGDSAWSGLRVLLWGHLAGWCPSLVLLVPVGKGHQAPEQERNIPSCKGVGAAGSSQPALACRVNTGSQKVPEPKANCMVTTIPPSLPTLRPGPAVSQSPAFHILPPAGGVTVAPVAMRWVPRDPILHSARTLRRPAHLSVPRGSAVPSPGSFLP